MRRRVKERAEGEGPLLPLRHFRGHTNREALTWIRSREEWWTTTADPDDSGWPAWLLDGWEQVGDLSWCGSIGTPCANDDCMCITWPEHATTQDDPNQQTRAHRAIERHNR